MGIKDLRTNKQSLTPVNAMQHLILLHGALGSASQFDLLKDRFTDHFNVHTINFSGHGGQPMPDKNFSISLFADEVREFIKENKLLSVNFFGYSMGGYVALYLAKHSPDLVNKIITLATKFHWDEDVAAREAKMLDPEKISAKIPAFAEELKQRHHPNDWKDVLSKTREMLLELGKENVLQTEDYRSISNESLLLIGDNDKMVSVDETTAVFNALPDARMKILPETSHPIEQVNVKLLSELIKDFINTVG
jgi:pimeloyl-ACP methyl ester carboxylesterase